MDVDVDVDVDVDAGAKVADVPGWASRLIPDGDDLRTDPSAPPVVIIDGHYLIFRSFHGMPPLTTADGTPVGALVGFCNVMNKLVSMRLGFAPTWGWGCFYSGSIYILAEVLPHPRL